MAQAKQRQFAAVLETHPNVFDLECMFYHNNHKTLELHTSMSNVRTGKKKKAMVSALLNNKSDDPYCDHTQLRPKLRLYPNSNKPVAESRVWLGF